MGLSRDDPDFDTAIAVDYGAVAYAAAMRKTHGMATLPATKDPLAIVNLAHAYGVERHHPKDAYDRLMMPQKAERRAEAKKESKKRKRKERGEEPGAKRVKFLSVIEDYDHARSMYTPVYFYGEHLLQKASAEAAENCYLLDSSAQGDIRKMAREKFQYLTADNKEPFNFLSRSAIARQPGIRDEIIAILLKDQSKSWQDVADDIDGWCSARTIDRWFTSHCGATYGAEATLPLLTTAQMAEHVRFAKHFLNGWGREAEPTILVHYDEKWFHGYVGRRNNKICEAPGLHHPMNFCQHKCHIPKIMVVAFTGYAYGGNIEEDGGDGLMLGLYRCMAGRMAQKNQRAGRKDDEGRQRYDGELIREKGRPYMVDATVKGVSSGTSTNPSFSLREIFEHQIIPLLEKLVGPPATCGDKEKYQEEKQRYEADPENNSPPIADPSLYGKYQNYGVVVQGDNAGPHREGNFQAWCKEQCQIRSHWYWEPQAAQMPYSNNLDLAVFPCMSKIHSHLLKEGGEKAIGNNDAIWKRCQDTWSDLTSEKSLMDMCWRNEF